MDRKEKTILITIVAQLSLVLMKFLLGAVSGSLALRASAWHSVSDVFVSGVVLVGLFMSRRSFSTQQRVGIVENGLALMVSVFMMYTAFDIFRDVSGIGELPDLTNIWPVTLGAFVTIGITYFTARYKEYVGQATQSLSLIASGYHSRMDLYASALIVIGLIAALIGFPTLDRIAAAVVVVLIVVSSLEIGLAALAAFKQQRVLEPERYLHPKYHLKGTHVSLLGGFLAVLFVVSASIYSIPLGQQAVVQRFGKVIQVVQPGIHVRLPLFDQITLHDIGAVISAKTPQLLVLSGDNNLVEASLAVQYRVTDIKQYLFAATNPDQFLMEEVETSFRQVVSEQGADKLFTDGRGLILSDARERVRKRIAEDIFGIDVVGVELVTITPPEEIADAFRDVASAREDKSTYINEALAYKNETIALARGESAKLVTESKAEKERKIRIATGESTQFSSKLIAYQTAPAVTRTRLYLEMLEQVLPESKKFILDPQVQTNATDIWIGNQN